MTELRTCAREGCEEQFEPGNKWWKIYCSRKCGDVARLQRSRANRKVAAREAKIAERLNAAATPRTEG